MKPGHPEDADLRFDAENMASARECTGLMPSLQVDDKAQEACARLYAVHRPKVPGRMFRKK